MPRDGQYICFTGEEAAAVHQWDLERGEFFTTWEALHQLVKDSPEAVTHLTRLEVLLNAVTVEACHVIHARLCRLIPHLADVAALACFPEFMPTPEFLEQRGTPLPWVLAGKRALAKEGDCAE